MAPEREEEHDQALRGLEHEIGRLLHRIRRGLNDRAAQVDPGLTATAYPLLVALVDRGPHRAADLADLFALDKGGVSRVVHQLLELGLIERARDPQDGRASIISATPKAHARLSVTRGRRHQELGARLADWDAATISDLAGGLARFSEAVYD